MGLCYKCDEKYTIDRVCKNISINFLLVDEDEDGEPIEVNEPKFEGEEKNEDVMEISVKVLAENF